MQVVQGSLDQRPVAVQERCEMADRAAVGRLHPQHPRPKISQESTREYTGRTGQIEDVDPSQRADRVH